MLLLDNSLICIFLDCEASVAETANWAAVLEKIIIICEYSGGWEGKRTVLMLMYVFINPISIKKDV